jgi:HEAT repeat protein
MTDVNLSAVAARLESPRSADRMIGLAELRDVPPEQAVPLIRLVLEDDNLQVRSMAVFALGIKPLEGNVETLIGILQSGDDYSIRAAAAGALGYLQDGRAFEPLRHSLYEDTEWLVRFSAAVALGNLQDPRARDCLVEALDSPEPIIHQAAIAALGEIGAVDAVDAILRFADAEDWLVRQRLAEALGCLPGEKSVSALRYLEKDAHPHVREAARLSLARVSVS